MTNLTEKFTDLETQLTAQHNTVVLSIGAVQVELSTKLTGVQTRLDTIIEKLGDINTTLTNNGSFDVAPIVNAITSLRGEGPENTIKSVNTSIWNLAGAAPGRSLSDLYNLWDPGEGIAPYNLLDNIYTAIVALRGSGTLNTLADIRSAISVIEQTLDSNWPNMISRLIDINDTSALELAQLALLVQQFRSSFVFPTMKDLMLTISQQQAQLSANTSNPLTTIPADICAAPLVSIGSFFLDTSAFLVEPVTIATWPAEPGGDFSASYNIIEDAHTYLHCTNWTAYRIYVASLAGHFGVLSGRGERYPTNKWIVLSIPEGPLSDGAQFNVDRSTGLKVYICPIDAPALGTCPGSTDPLTVTSWWRSNYNNPTPPYLAWMANAWTGGSTWSQTIQKSFAEETFYGFSVTRPVTSVALCVAWDATNDPTVGRIGIQAFDANLSEIADVFIDIIIDEGDTIGSISRQLNLVGLENIIGDIMLVPWVGFADAHTLPPNVTLSISWVDLS